VDQRAGLLVGRGGAPGQPSSYAFAHRTFQEYLAGCYLVNLRRPEKEIEKLAGEPEFWSLAVQLGAEELFYNGLTRSRDDMLDLAEALFDDAMRDITHRRSALWAGKMLAVAGAEVARQRSPDLVERLIPALMTLVGSDLTPVERADAGRALATLGDPRPEAMTVAGMQFCHIPEGKFRMGSRKDDEGSFADEQPPHEVDLPDFWMARYTVTNAQFEEFVNAGGYAEPSYWPEAQEVGVWKDGFITTRYEREARNSPYDIGEFFTLPNHPVIGVTWYEALAFIRWAETHFKKLAETRQANPGLKEADRRFWGWLAGGQLRVTLPSEAEWEKAARGTDGRNYPWGDKYDPDNANTSETGIGTTSAVGCFPGGAGPYGLLDMSGNVWEWTRSTWEPKKYPYPYNPADGREDIHKDAQRVVRGGSFLDNAWLARCAFRGWFNPASGYYDFGFRVVVSRTSPNSGR
jgi:formylglycine-generating enzyme required for sulfatase activity